MQGNTETPALARERSSFTLTEGGPFYRIMTRLRLRTPTSMARCWWLGVLLWLPLAVDEGVRVLLDKPLDTTLFDISLHARLLFTLPVLLVSERLFDRTIKSAMTSLYNGRFCEPASIDAIVDRAERLRDSKKAELVMLGIAILGGQLVLWRVFGATGLFHGGEEIGFWSFSRVWYALVALPLVQFVMLRWMWRWLIWGYMIARIAKLPLFVLATHADYAGGLGALARPVSAFSAFVLANSAILAGAWATQVLDDRTTLRALVPMLVTFEVAALALAVGPLLLLSAHLFRARRRTLAEYSDFMRTYTLDFHAKWIAQPSASASAERALGSSDIQSLSDLGDAFKVVSNTRAVIFGPRTVFAVWFAGLLPMLPLFASTLTVESIFKRIISTVLGGFPL